MTVFLAAAGPGKTLCDWITWLVTTLAVRMGEAHTLPPGFDPDNFSHDDARLAVAEKPGSSSGCSLLLLPPLTTPCPRLCLLPFPPPATPAVRMRRA